jgi:hypothetical protein
MSDRPTCETCRWWDWIGRHVGPTIVSTGEPVTRGYCRRHAPIVSDWEDGDVHWPATHPTDWCGEHAPKGGDDA